MILLYFSVSTEILSSGPTLLLKEPNIILEIQTMVDQYSASIENIPSQLEVPEWND